MPRLVASRSATSSRGARAAARWHPAGIPTEKREEQRSVPSVSEIGSELGEDVG